MGFVLPISLRRGRNGPQGWPPQWRLGRCILQLSLNALSEDAFAFFVACRLSRSAKAARVAAKGATALPVVSGTCPRRCRTPGPPAAPQGATAPFGLAPPRRCPSEGGLGGR
eukprot:2288592-Alexandrium_andersonii.AAC.1